jgi:DNA-binding transcriptional LysR family regulator
VRAGLGVAMVPCSIGETEPELIRCLPPVGVLNAQTWLLVRADLRSAPHVRAFVDFLADRMADEIQDRPPVL